MLAIILEILGMLAQALGVATLIYGIYLVFQARSYISFTAVEDFSPHRHEKNSNATNVLTLEHGNYSKDSVSYRRVA